MLIIVTILINVGAIAAWSFITGQNGFKEAAKMLRGEPAFIRDESPNAKLETGETQKGVEAGETEKEKEERDERRRGRGES